MLQVQIYRKHIIIFFKENDADVNIENEEEIEPQNNHDTTAVKPEISSIKVRVVGPRNCCEALRESIRLLNWRLTSKTGVVLKYYILYTIKFYTNSIQIIYTKSMSNRHDYVDI